MMFFRLAILLLLLVFIGVFDQTGLAPEVRLPSGATLAGAFLQVRPGGGIDTAAAQAMGMETRLASCDLVLLGEAQHGDGATFERKIEWIRYLHERFHFDWLLLESGIWAGIPLDAHIQNGQNNPATIGHYVWYFWAEAEETAGLWPFLTQAGIRVGGFDLQFTGSMQELAGQFQQIIQRAGLPDTLFGHTRRWLETVDVSGLNGYHINPPEADKIPMTRELTLLRDSLSASGRPGAALDRLLVCNLLWDLDYWALAPDARNGFRDSIMAYNILEFQRHLPEGHRKIMIWAANAHVLHQNPAQPVFPYKTMGDYVYEKVGPRNFTVLFSSFGGQSRNVYNQRPFNIFDAGNRSLEYQITGMGLGEGIVDFHRLPAAAVFKLRALGHGNHLAPWHQMADALHFIPQMTPFHPVIERSHGPRN